MDIYPVREETLVRLSDAAGGDESQVVTAQNFAVELWQPSSGARLERTGEFESIVIVSAGNARVETADDAIGSVDDAIGSVDDSIGSVDDAVELGAGSVAIVPAGTFRVVAGESAQVVIVHSIPPEALRRRAINSAHYTRADERIVPSQRHFRRVSNPGRINRYEVANLATLPHADRTRMIQSDAISINWVEYEGERDPTRLSPHNHSAFEQVSLGLRGSFTYHLRVPWMPDSTAWRADRHERIDAPCIGVFPVGLIHTVTGSPGSGRNLLIDIFSPVRDDFVEKGWVANSAEYEPIG